MRAAVREQFVYFSAAFEGRVPCMYLDVKGLVTCGVGNLIDPIGDALGLPWQSTDGTLATRNAILSEWHRVKAAVARAHGPTSYWLQVATLRLSTGAIDALVLTKLDQFEAQLKKRPQFAGLEDWPADAQLGIFSMTWAMGSAFDFPHFEAACASGDFNAAAAQCHMADSNNPGLVPRNRANSRLFANAAIVQGKAMDPETLFYPRTLA